MSDCQARTMLAIIVFILFTFFHSSLAAPKDMLSAPNTTIPNCPRKCGNITIPYPFGIGSDCSIGTWYSIFCDASIDPPKAFLPARNHEIVEISNTQMKIRNRISFSCFDSEGQETSSGSGVISLLGSPFTISGTANKFTVLGCDAIAVLSGSRSDNLTSLGGCIAWCAKKEHLIDGSCSGLGCCQTAIPGGLQTFFTILRSSTNLTSVWSFDRCIYGFLVDQDSFVFQVEDLSNPAFVNETIQNVPVVLEWEVGEGFNCSQAKKDLKTYACKVNSNCTDSSSTDLGGYNCHCLPGYEGNPYIGCTDIDECASPDNLCSHICTNSVGNYECSCPRGYHGDGLKVGTGCTAKSSQLAIRVSLGVSIGLLFAFVCISWIYFVIRKRKLMKMREEFFKQNGGLLLKQQISSDQSSTDSTKIFSADELKLATGNYSEDRILGRGGNGTVYKGILPDNRIVAIKRSKVVDETQTEQFINEVVILTQINHRNVVKLLGCCLETEVPSLVYEYISNGSLLEHIHTRSRSSWLTWPNCLRIASEAADALHYLHSSANIPVIHRDVKSANILLDQAYTAKIADFGASRLIAIDQTQVNTLVQGTLGYLDPEYFQTSQLTEKSDVYSFGVVMAELLTREKPVSLERKMEERNLAMRFVLAVKENRVMEIIHPQLKEEANQEELVTMAMLVKRCLSVRGEDRPNMREVAIELDGLRKHVKHPWADRADEDTHNLIGQGTEDLYPVPMPTGENADTNDSLQNDMIINMRPR